MVKLKSYIKNTAQAIAPAEAKGLRAELKPLRANADTIYKDAAKQLDDLKVKQAKGFGGNKALEAENAAAIKKAEKDLAGAKTQKNNLDAADEALKKAKDPKQLGALAKLKKACTDNKAMCAGIAATAAVFTAAAIATVAKESITYNITKIEYVKDNKANITFKPAQDIYTKDTVTLAGTDCVPSIDGSYSDIETIASNVIQIGIDNPLTQNGTKGTMTLDTDPLNQLALAAKKAKDAAKDGICGILPCDIFGSAGKWVWIIICALVFLSCVASSVYAATR